MSSSFREKEAPGLPYFRPDCAGVGCAGSLGHTRHPRSYRQSSCYYPFPKTLEFCPASRKGLCPSARSWRWPPPRAREVGAATPRGLSERSPGGQPGPWSTPPPPSSGMAGRSRGPPAASGSRSTPRPRSQQGRSRHAPGRAEARGAVGPDSPCGGRARGADGLPYRVRADRARRSRSGRPAGASDRPVAPTGPAAPLKPLAPLAPVCPVVPAGPVAPVAPATPGGPVTLGTTPAATVTVPDGTSKPTGAVAVTL